LNLAKASYFLGLKNCLPLRSSGQLARQRESDTGFLSTDTDEHSGNGSNSLVQKPRITAVYGHCPYIVTCAMQFKGSA